MNFFLKNFLNCLIFSGRRECEFGINKNKQHFETFKNRIQKLQNEFWRKKIKAWVRKEEGYSYKREEWGNDNINKTMYMKWKYNQKSQLPSRKSEQKYSLHNPAHIAWKKYNQLSKKHCGQTASK